MNITVYCGARLGRSQVYRDAGLALARWITARDYTLVYGGGNVGLMGVIANAVLACGGAAIGVMPTFLIERELAHDHLTELIVVATMSERKNMMIDLGDCFIALPGGPGTLEEITEAVSWSRIGQNSSPCIFFNVNGYFDAVRQQYTTMVDEGFLSPAAVESIFFVDAIEQFDAIIASYRPPDIRSYK